MTVYSRQEKNIGFLRACFLLVSLDCARHVSLVQKTTRYAGGK